MTGGPLRVAVVGSGPAGVYATEALIRSGAAEVDVLERLPTPYGLVRYGVAPDHVKMKEVITTLAEILETPGVRFLGGIEVGRDIAVHELQRYYDAVVFTHGAALDRRLGIPGEDLPGSYSATDFVNWYSGHPDSPFESFDLQAESVVVIGVGNVAVDVCRVLLKDPDELAATDVPDHVLDVFRASRVREVAMVGRRGPEHARFTTKELRDLGDTSGIDVLIDPVDLDMDPTSEQVLAANAAARRNLGVLQSWALRQPTGSARRLSVRFLLRPVELLGSERVEAVRWERMQRDGSGGVMGTGALVETPAQLVFRSIGYRGVALAGLPFDETLGIVPNEAGRVLREGVASPGEYVAGWIKRGPTGVIGTNRRDAAETVRTLVDDAGRLPRAHIRDPAAVAELLTARGVEVVQWQGWRGIDAAEIELGRRRGATRVKLAARAELYDAARASRRTDD